MYVQTASSEDWKATAQLLGEAAGAGSMHEMVEVVMRQMHGLFNAEIVIFDRLNGQMRPLGFQMYPVPTPELIRRAHPPFLAFLHQHPFQRNWVQTVGEGQVGLLSDRISGRDFRRTAFWNEAFIHLRGKNQLMVGGRIEPDRYWNFSLLRLGRDFGPRDRELCRFLQPHLNRLLQRQTRHDRAGRTMAALNHAQAAYLMVDAGGQVLEISDQAHALLSKPGSNAQSQLITFAARHIRAGVFSQPLENLQAMIFRPAPGAPALIMLGEEVQAGLPPASRLTPRETEILHWLGEGKTNAEIALLLGVSPRTVEKHCEQLFAKLGVESRLAAALLARH